MLPASPEDALVARRIFDTGWSHDTVEAVLHAADLDGNPGDELLVANRSVVNLLEEGRCRIAGRYYIVYTAALAPAGRPVPIDAVWALGNVQRTGRAGQELEYTLFPRVDRSVQPFRPKFGWTRAAIAQGWGWVVEISL